MTTLQADVVMMKTITGLTNPAIGDTDPYDGLTKRFGNTAPFTTTPTATESRKNEIPDLIHPISQNFMKRPGKAEENVIAMWQAMTHMGLIEVDGVTPKMVLCDDKDVRAGVWFPCYKATLATTGTFSDSTEMGKTEFNWALDLLLANKSLTEAGKADLLAASASDATLKGLENVLPAATGTTGSETRQYAGADQITIGSSPAVSKFRGSTAELTSGSASLSGWAAEITGKTWTTAAHAASANAASALTAANAASAVAASAAIVRIHGKDMYPDSATTASTWYCPLLQPMNWQGLLLRPTAFGGAKVPSMLPSLQKTLQFPTPSLLRMKALVPPGNSLANGPFINQANTTSPVGTASDAEAALQKIFAKERSVGSGDENAAFPGPSQSTGPIDATGVLTVDYVQAGKIDMCHNLGKGFVPTGLTLDVTAVSDTAGKNQLDDLFPAGNTAAAALFSQSVMSTVALPATKLPLSIPARAA